MGVKGWSICIVEQRTTDNIPYGERRGWADGYVDEERCFYNITSTPGVHPSGYLLFHWRDHAGHGLLIFPAFHSVMVSILAMPLLKSLTPGTDGSRTVYI